MLRIPNFSCYSDSLVPTHPTYDHIHNLWRNIDLGSKKSTPLSTESSSAKWKISFALRMRKYCRRHEDGGCQHSQYFFYRWPKPTLGFLTFLATVVYRKAEPKFFERMHMHVQTVSYEAITRAAEIDRSGQVLLQEEERRRDRFVAWLVSVFNFTSVKVFLDLSLSHTDFFLCCTHVSNCQDWQMDINGRRRRRWVTLKAPLLWHNSCNR